MRTARLIALALAASCGGSQTATRPEPEPVAPAPATQAAPADPQPTVDGDVTEARVGGMQILIKNVPGAEIVAMQLHVRGGVRNWGKADAGVEALLMRTAASGGAGSLDKSAFARKLADLGSVLFADAGDDYSSIRASSLKPAWPETFQLLVDVFRRPALPDGEIALQRQRQLNQLRREQEIPDGRLALLVNQGIFGDHPYGNRAVGTLETVGKLDAAALRAHHAKLQESGRLLLVVVGDVDAGAVLEAARRGLGDLPRGAYEETALPEWKPSKAGVFVTEQKLPTNYISSVFPGARWRDPDFTAGMVAIFLLDDRLFQEVRTKRNLSYAPNAWLDFDTTLPRGTLYVSAVDPKTTMKVMLDEARRLRSQPVPDKQLAGAKASMLTRYFLQNEASDGQAFMLARAQILGGDWRMARTIKDRVAAVGAAEVQAFAQKHLDHLQTFVLGDPKTVDEALLTAPL